MRASATAALASAALAAVAGCGPGSERAERARTAGAETLPLSFTARGRWEDPTDIGYLVDAADAPIPADDARRTIERALAAWEATGVVAFREAGDGAEPDVTFSWRRGSHGSCRPFDCDTSIAHCGPVRPGTFVHFDASTAWTLEERGGGPAGPHPLLHAAMHEVGHVLGLGHSEDERSVMSPMPEAPTRVSPVLAAADLAGLFSLYGGGERGPSDLEILAAGDGALRLAAPALRGVAPPGITSWEVFDTDGDGDDEILVWRTDGAGHGALQAFHFEAGPRLERTVGPLFGSVAADTPIQLGVTGAGERALANVYPDGRIDVRLFDARGVLAEIARGAVVFRDDGTGGGGIRIVDQDADGFLDEEAGRSEAGSGGTAAGLAPGLTAGDASDGRRTFRWIEGGREYSFEASRARAADLDGDGVRELVVAGPRSDRTASR